MQWSTKRRSKKMVTLEYLNRFAVRAKRYFRRGWGYPFICGFLILLLTSAIVLAVGCPYWAEPIADVAYFLLVAGVILELVYLSKKESREGYL